MRNEEARYAAVSDQITQLLDDATKDTSPVTALLRAQLVAEMYRRNEQAHTGYQARVDLVTALQWRIQGMRVESEATHG